MRTRGLHENLNQGDRELALPTKVEMPREVSQSSDEFEYIETPAAPTPSPPSENYGVRTTNVCSRLRSNVGATHFL